MKSRKLIHPHELKILPVGAVVANGYKIGEEWIFRKTAEGLWKLYDPSRDDYTPHERLSRRHEDWASAEGFSDLNLPVYVLSREGEREESLHFLSHWRKHKLGWLGS